MKTLKQFETHPMLPVSKEFGDILNAQTPEELNIAEANIYDLVKVIKKDIDDAAAEIRLKNNWDAPTGAIGNLRK